MFYLFSKGGQKYTFRIIIRKKTFIDKNYSCFSNQFFDNKKYAIRAANLHRNFSSWG